MACLDLLCLHAPRGIPPIDPATRRVEMAEPFEMATVHLDGWTLGLDAPNDASGSAISLPPPAGLPHH